MHPQQSKVIAELYNSVAINKVVSRIEPASSREDIKQQLFLTLCCMRKDKFDKICRTPGGGIEQYAITSLRINSLMQARVAKATEKKKNKFLRYAQSIHLSDLTPSSKIRLLEKGLAGLPNYHQKMLEIYIQTGNSSAKVSKLTGIAERTVRHNIQKTREILKQQIKASND